MRDKTKWWWDCCSGMEDPLAMVADEGQYVQYKYGTTLWEDGDFSKKLEDAVL